MLRDVRQPDSYVHHLMAMTKSHEVKTTEDILNQQGAVLLPKGRVINHEMAERIIAHKLIKPIETFLELGDGLDGDRLLALYREHLKKHPDYQLFHQEMQLEDMLESCCRYYSQFPLLIQKMTVLQVSLPHVFHQAMFCAYAGLAIARKMQVRERDCLAVFVAGLVHDIGMLHIDPRIILKTGHYSAEEWRAMQAHTVIGHCILKYVDGLPMTIVNSVLEHHERSDGSGYPMGKEGVSLGMMGQIIGMTDTCLALYNRELKPKGLSFDALLPILQLNPDVYCRQVFTATVALIRDIPWQPKRVYADEKMPEVVSKLILEHEFINHDYCILYGIVTTLKQTPITHHSLNVIVKMGERISQCLLSSGVLQAEHDQWMVSSCDQKRQQDYVAIERIEIMYSEVKWQLQQLKRMVFLLWKNQTFQNSDLRDLVRQGLLEIEHYHKLHKSPSLPLN